MVSIESFLRKVGYRPDVSNSNAKYLKVLKNTVGEKKANDYLQWFDEKLNDGLLTEDSVWEYIGNDLEMMKVIISSQIGISIACLEYFISILKDYDTKNWNILELGASDGWASAYIMEYFNIKGEVATVDKNPYWLKADKKLNNYHVSYSEFNSQTKFNLIFSILGAPEFGFNELLSCISRHSTDETIILLGLRIPGENSFEYLNEMTAKNLLSFNFEKSLKIEKVGPAKESIPVFVLKKNRADSLSNYLRLSKKLWYGIEKPRRLVGSEAKFLWNLIKDSSIIKTEELKFETSFSKLECIRFNSLDFLVWTNSFGDIIIDYPVLPNEIEMTISDFEQSVFYKSNTEYHPKP